MNKPQITSRTFNRYVDLSQEDLSTMMPQDGIYEDIDCMYCEGEGCEECDFTGLED